MAISTTGKLETHVVIQEARTTDEFRITTIEENIIEREVFVRIELGPFIPTYHPKYNDVIPRGSTVRNICVWNDEEYDAIRDTWTNQDLVDKVIQLLGQM